MSETYVAVQPASAGAPSIQWTSDQGANNDQWTQSESSVQPEDQVVKCSQCAYQGPQSSFPLRLNGNGHVKTCIKHTKPRRITPKSGHVLESSPSIITVPWATLLDEIHVQAQGAIDLDRFFELEPDHQGATGETLLIRANTVMDSIKTAAGYRFNYKRRQDSTQKSRKSTVFTYYCAQLEGEQTKHALHPDESRRRPKKLPKIPRFHCNGWAALTVTDGNPTLMRLRMTHAFAHIACYSNRPAGVGVGPSASRTSATFSSDPRLSTQPSTSSDIQASPIVSTAAAPSVSEVIATELEGGGYVASEVPVVQFDAQIPPPAPGELPHEVQPLIPNDAPREGFWPEGAPDTTLDVDQRVCFPDEYLMELKRKASFVFAEADKVGGMTIPEARAFEAAFAPLTQLADELEAGNNAEQFKS